MGVFAFELKYGDLYLYGDNMKVCMPYLRQGTMFTSIEDVCAYCQMHNFKMYYDQNRKSRGWLLDYLRIMRLIFKYSVFSSGNRFSKFIDQLKLQIEEH